jgi:hypothetical protein
MYTLLCFLWDRTRQSKGLTHFVWIILLVGVAVGTWFGFDRAKRMSTHREEHGNWAGQPAALPAHGDAPLHRPFPRDERCPEYPGSRAEPVVQPHGRDDHRGEHGPRIDWRR